MDFFAQAQESFKKHAAAAERDFKRVADTAVATVHRATESSHRSVAATPLLTEAVSTREVVCWGSVDPADGSISLYSAHLAATFENHLAEFAAEAEESVSWHPFDLPLPNGNVLRASMRFQRGNAEHPNLVIDQFTQGGQRWVMRLSLGEAKVLDVATDLRVGVRAWSGAGGYGGHTYATARAEDVWFVSVRAGLRHLVLAAPLPADLPLDAPLCEALSSDGPLPIPLEPATPASLLPRGPWAGDVVRDAESARARARAFALHLQQSHAARRPAILVATELLREWEGATDAIRAAHAASVTRSSRVGAAAAPVEASDAFRACGDEFSRQLVQRSQDSLGVLRKYANDPKGSARAELETTLHVVQWLSADAAPHLARLAPMGSRFEPHRILCAAASSHLVPIHPFPSHPTTHSFTHPPYPTRSHPTPISSHHPSIRQGPAHRRVCLPDAPRLARRL